MIGNDFLAYDINITDKTSNTNFSVIQTRQ